MKKIMALLLLVCMLCSFVACGTADLTVDSNEDAVQVPAEGNEEIAEDEKPAEQIDFPETVIVDDENCTFKITAIDANGMWGYTLKVYMENKTDINLTFSWDNTSVNGLMCDPFWAASVSAGMKANEEISFAESTLDEYGIKEITNITFGLRVYNEDDWTADALIEEIYSVYPLGEDAAQAYVREPQSSDLVLFDTDACTMIVTGYDPDSMWGYAVKVFLVNKTEKTLMFSTNDATVNGYMCDPFWATEVAPGKMSYAEISWFEDDFELNGITEVESITLPVRVYNSDDWMEADLISETFELNP